MRLVLDAFFRCPHEEIRGRLADLWLENPTTRREEEQVRDLAVLKDWQNMQDPRRLAAS